MIERLRARAAIVTGAAGMRGIGRAIALRFARDGLDVALVDGSFIGSRAVWEPSRLRELVACIAEPASVGLSAIAGLVHPLHRYERLAPLMHELRVIKTDHELVPLNEAIRITDLGFRRLLKFVKPGVHEFEIEAELAHEYLRHRASGFAYPPIIASGANACVLHYVTNDAPCNDGDFCTAGDVCSGGSCAGT